MVFAVDTLKLPPDLLPRTDIQCLAGKPISYQQLTAACSLGIS